MVDGAAIIAEAKRWMGTPWQHQAARKGVGCDCIGLVSGVADALGMPEARTWRADTRFSGYGELPLPDMLLAACDIYLDRLPTVAAARLGDVLVFTLLRDPMHFGLLSVTGDRQYMIHGWRPAGRVVENVIDNKWRRRIVRAYRYKGRD
jgi:NlpC/P60 family putative phage cell wall peptidase